MSDIFISYSSKDRSKVIPLAKELEQHGWSVWWDRNITVGQDFDKVIQGALDKAKCIVVVWSAESVNSEYVRDEAEEGRKRNVLVPVLIEEVQAPLGFRRIQALRLKSLQDSQSHSGYDELFIAISRTLGQPIKKLEKAGGRGRKTVGRFYALLCILLPTVLLIVLVAVLMVWRIPTQVEVDLIVDRIMFTVGDIESESIPIVGQFDFQSLTIEAFADISFDPQGLRVADPKEYDPVKDQFRETAWRSVKPNGEVKFTRQDSARNWAVTLENKGADLNSGGTLDPIRLRRGTTVTLEKRGKQDPGLTIKILGEEVKTVVKNFELFEIITDQSTINDIAEPVSPDEGSLTYEARLKKDDTFINITGGKESLILSFRVREPGITALLSEGVITVADLDFTKQGDLGNRVSTLVKSGTIRYPDYPEIKQVSFKKPDFIGLDQLEKFSIKTLNLVPDGLHLILHGTAGRISVGLPDFPQDHRLTVFDTLWESHRVKSLFVIVSGFIAMFVGLSQVMGKAKT